MNLGCSKERGTMWLEGHMGESGERPEGHREAKAPMALGVNVWIILKNRAELPESLSQT